MRIERLELQAFGSFEKLRLDLGQNGGGFHLIYGPNEAGKSTTLTALRYLLFGIPHQPEKSFRFPYDQIRLSGELRNDRGQRLAVVRRKAKKNSLRDADDDQPVPEERLAAFLGHVSESTFESSFGLDHARLVAGGQAVVAGNGDLGELLFAARGGGGLKKLQEELGSQIDELFKAKGHKQHLAVLIKRYAQLHQEARQAKVSPVAWKRLAAQEDELRRRKQELVAQRELWRSRRRVAERMRKVLRLAPRWDHLRQQRDDLAKVRLLPSDFRARRCQVATTLAERTALCQALRTELQDRQDQLNALPEPNAELLAISELVVPLRQQGPHWAAAQRDRLHVHRDLRDAQAAMERTLGQLGAVLDEEAALAPLAHGRQLHKLASRYGELQNSQQAKSAAIGELESEIELLQEKLGRAGSAELDLQLRGAVHEARRQGDLDRRRQHLRLSLVQQREQLEKAAQRLPGWTASWNALESLSVPTEATVALFIQRWDELAARFQEAQEQAQQATGRLAELRQKQRDLSLDGRLPCEEDLQRARALRERGWMAVLRAWNPRMGPPVDPSAADDFIAACRAQSPQARDDDDLAGWYRHTVLEADRIADALRREADRVAELSQLATEELRLLAQLQQGQERLQACGVQRDALLQDWRQPWRDARIQPQSPKEMLAWLQELKLIRQLLQQLRHDEVELRQVEQLMQDHLQRLQRRLPPTTSEQAVEPDARGALLDRWADLLTAAEAALEVAEQRARDGRSWREELDRLRRRLAAARRDHQELTEELELWWRQWRTLAAQLPESVRENPLDAPPCLDLLNEAARQHELVKERRRRLKEIDHFCAQFANNLQHLAANPVWRELPAVQQAGDHPATLAATMVAALDEQTQCQRRRQVLLQDINQREDKLTREMRSQAQVELQQHLLCQEAGCPQVEQLLELEQASDRKREIETAWEAVQSQLFDLTDGEETPEQLIHASRFLEAAELEREMEQIDVDVHDSKVALDQLDEQLLSVSVELRKLEGPATAAAAAEAANDVLVELTQTAEYYARLKAAQIVLQHALEDYRQRQQGPLLSRASELFGMLTKGSFSGVKIEVADNGKPMLVGLRHHSRELVQVHGMSDGSADQLYLALRLAWIEHYLDKHESLPLIVDDLLIQFDNERAVQTLKVLAELSQRTQVLFFTHHLHLVELAETAITQQLIFHELDGRAQASTRTDAAHKDAGPTSRPHKRSAAKP